MKDDSDETEGRKLYRDIANKYARYQINLKKRKVIIKSRKKARNDINEIKE